MLVGEIPFVVVDVETTGLKAGEDRIIELAAVKFEDGAVTDRFSQLINPERSVPRRITRMTGITTAMLFDQPVIADVLPDFMSFLGEGVFVAHNLPFDQRFIEAALEQVGGSALSSDTLCTLRLARRLLPGLSSKSLSSVTDFYGISVDGRHRALGDAAATAEVLGRFLKKMSYAHDIETVEELLSFQYCSYSKVGLEREHLTRLREKVAAALPQAPGVYFMKDEKGVLLYIGKAKDLKARVSSYFTGLASKAKHIRKMMETVHEVDWQETPSELHALLLESRLIKKNKPAFNRAQRRYRSRPFIRLDTTEEYPRVSSTGYLRNDGAEYFGPVGGRRTAEFIIDLINRSFKLRECSDDTFAEGRRCLYAQIDRCEAPCEDEASVSCYEVEVRRVRDFLTGQDDTILTYLEDRMRQAAAELAFEEASYYRDSLKKLKRLLERQRCVAASVLNHNAVVLHPSRSGTQVRLFCVRHGRLADLLVVSSPPTRKQEEQICERLDQHYRQQTERPERYFKKDVDEVRLLAQWLYKERRRVEQVHWQRQPVDAYAADVLSTVEHLGRQA